MSKLKIVTHDGIFHADEVFAVALLENYFNCEAHITRTRDLPNVPGLVAEAQANPETWVLDVGFELNVKNLNFDHHQDIAGLPATNVLIYKYLQPTQKFTQTDVYEELEPFMHGISAYDTNKFNIHADFQRLNTEGDIPFKNGLQLVSHVISGFNRNPTDHENQAKQFRQAVNLAKVILENEINSAKQRIHAHNIWKWRETMADGQVIVFDEFCATWKVLVQKNRLPVKVAVMETGGKWGITVINVDTYKLPDEDTIKAMMSDPSQFIFVHASGFTSGFKTKEAAVEVANKLFAV